MAQEATHTYMPDGRIITTYTNVPDKPNVFSTTPAEMQQIANRGGGVLAEIGKTTVIKPSAEYLKAEAAKASSSDITPRIATGTSGYYVQSSTGVYVPVSKGVADLITANNAAAANNVDAAAILGTSPNINVGQINKFTLPQTYTASTTLDEQLKSNKLNKNMVYSPETVGQQTYNTMQNIMSDTGYQTAFMFKKLITGESLIAAGAGGIAALAGKYPEYQRWLQSRWTGEQQQETYQMSQFGSKMVYNPLNPEVSKDIFREQFMQAKFMEIVPPAAMWIAPAFMGNALSAVVGAGKIATTTAQLWAKIGVAAMGAGVAYGTSEAYQGISLGTPEGFYRAATGIEIGAFFAYGLKQMWATAFPQKMLLTSYEMKYQGYSGENRELRGQYPSYRYMHEYRYSDIDVKNLPSTSMSDEAVYINVKGYRLLNYAGEGGYPVKQEFNIMERFRINERAGTFNPLSQNIGDIDIKHPFGSGQSVVNLGTAFYGTDRGVPDVLHGFTFEQLGYTENMNIEGWEKQFKTLPAAIAISPNEPYIKGTGMKIVEAHFDKLLAQMVADKNLVIENAQMNTFFLEPDTHQPYLSFQSPNKAPTWITTGDYYGYAPLKLDLFETLGLKDLTKVGGISSINLHEGSLVSVNTELAERLKVMPQIKYDIRYYDKAVPVLVNFPPDTSLTLIPPTVVGFAKGSVNYGMNFTGLKGEAGLGLKPEVKQFIQPALNLVYEPNIKQIPYSMPELKNELKPELSIEPRLQPALQPALALQPKLELEPRMDLRMQPMLQMRTEMRLEMKADILFGMKFKEKENVFFREEGRDWFKMGKSDMFGLGKKNKLRKETFKIEPKSDWLSRLQSEAIYGKATNIPNTPKYRRMFKEEFLGNPLGMFAGNMPTMEMMGKKEFIWVK